MTAACVVLAGCGGDGRGPLDEDINGSSATGGSAKPGQWFVVGLYTPKNGSDDTAVLEEIEPADGDEAAGLELRYGTTRCPIGSARGWPPASCRRGFQPFRGHRVLPDEQARIVVGARAARQGRWFIKAFRLRYRVGDERFSTLYRQGLCVRVTRVNPPPPCDLAEP